MAGAAAGAFDDADASRIDAVVTIDTAVPEPVSRRGVRGNFFRERLFRPPPDLFASLAAPGCYNAARIVTSVNKVKAWRYCWLSRATSGPAETDS